MLLVLFSFSLFSQEFPGVYVEEVENFPRNIESLATDRTAFLGVFPKFKTHYENIIRNSGIIPKQLKLTSETDYTKYFDLIEYDEVDSLRKEAQLYLQESVRLFFQNHGKTLYIYNVVTFDYEGYEAALIHSQNEEINIMAAPGLAQLNLQLSIDVYQNMISQSRSGKNIFVIIDSPKTDNLNSLISYRKNFDTSYAALYTHWLIKNANAIDFHVPASGAIAGIYARTDTKRNVWSAPAGAMAQVKGISGLYPDWNDTELLFFNKYSINQIKLLPQGIVLWGGRTLSNAIEKEFKYIPVRRTHMMISDSINKSLAWLAFEPNQANTWIKAKGSVSNYFLTLFREGAFAGTTPDHAFFVNCGLGTSMTTRDILNDRIVVDWGISVLRPAEFIVGKTVVNLLPQ